MPESDGLPCIFDIMAEAHDIEATQAPTNQDWKCCDCDERATRLWDGHPICNTCYWNIIDALSNADPDAYSD